MRLVDIILLALSSLWQQKVRTLLNTLCVVFSTFVVVVTMSASLGVQETILREYDRFGEVRRVHVYALTEPDDSEIQPGWLPVRGDMSEDRRQRLHREIQRRGPRRGVVRPQHPLDRSRLAELAALPHVRSATPVVLVGARATLNGLSHDSAFFAAPADASVWQNRLVAGAPLDANDRDGVLVSEYLLYSLGVVDEVEAARSVGQTLELDRRADGNNNAQLLLRLLHADPMVTPAQDGVMRRIAGRIPEALGTLDLSFPTRMILWALWSHQAPAITVRGPGFDRSFVIRGVYRIGPTLNLPGMKRDVLPADADLALNPRTAEALSLLAPAAGFNEIVLEVDDVDHVKEVAQQVAAMKLRPSALIEQLELEQFIYRMVLGTMTFVALIALVVAGLGIANTLQMSVLQRTREIGILKAVGARDGHVLLLFLAEGSLVGLVGGSIGLILGWASSYPGDAWVRSSLAAHRSVELEGSVFLYPWWLAVASLLFVWLATTLAAVIPAYRAARVDPVRALRHD